MREAINWIKKSSEIGIVYDYDVDGICSCALMILLLKKLGKDVKKYAVSPRPSFEKNPAIELVKHYQDIIILDISLENDKISDLKRKNVLNIDHHESGLKETTGNITILKNKNKYTPTSKIVYDLGLKIIGKEFEKYDWISAAGTIADYGGPSHKRFINKTLKRYDLKKGEDKAYFESDLGVIANVTNAIRTAGNPAKTGIAVRALMECGAPQDFLKGENAKVRLLYQLYNRIQEYIDQELERFYDKAKKTGDRVLFYLKNPKYNIRSTMITMISTKTDRTIAIAETRNTGNIHISLRSKKENVLDIIEEIKREIHATGGGHKNAAGVTIREEDLDTFKRIFLKIN